MGQQLRIPHSARRAGERAGRIVGVPRMPSVCLCFASGFSGRLLRRSPECRQYTIDLAGKFSQNTERSKPDDAVRPPNAVSLSLICQAACRQVPRTSDTIRRRSSPGCRQFGVDLPDNRLLRTQKRVSRDEGRPLNAVSSALICQAIDSWTRNCGDAATKSSPGCRQFALDWPGYSP